MPSPVMKQFRDLKEKHPDVVFLFHVGDFYEAYETDAGTASRILGITMRWEDAAADFITYRGAVASFPHHALDTYLPRLVRAGLRVAICDQLEDPRKNTASRHGIVEMLKPYTVGNGIRMQASDRHSSLLPAEKAMMSQIVADLETGNHLLGRPRPEGYWEFAAEHGGAVQALKAGAVLTARQRDILLERAGNYHGGIAELAEMLNMDVPRLRKALSPDTVREHRMERQYSIVPDGGYWYVYGSAGFGMKADYAERIAGLYSGEKYEHDGRSMMRFPTKDDAESFIGNVSMLNERYTNALRDALIDRLRRAGIAVHTDWVEGERVLEKENSRRAREHFAGSKDEFDIIREIVAKEKGVVTPGLAETEFTVVSVGLHDFTSVKPIEEAFSWGKKNLVTTLNDTVGASLPKMKDGEHYTISGKALEKFLSKDAVDKSENLDVHLSVFKKLKTVIGESIDTEVRPDYPKDEKGERLPLKYNKNGLIHILYGAVKVQDDIYRVKTTMQEFRGDETSKPHSYEAIKIELLASPINASFIRSFNIGQNDSDAKESTRISISGANLLNNVEKSKDSGKNLLEESKKSVGIEELLRKHAQNGIVEHRLVNESVIDDVVSGFAEKYHLSIDSVRDYYEGMAGEDLHQAQQAYYAIYRAYKENVKAQLGEDYKLSTFSHMFAVRNTYCKCFSFFNILYCLV